MMNSDKLVEWFSTNPVLTFTRDSVPPSSVEIQHGCWIIERKNRKPGEAEYIAIMQDGSGQLRWERVSVAEIHRQLEIERTKKEREVLVRTTAEANKMQVSITGRPCDRIISVRTPISSYTIIDCHEDTTYPGCSVSEAYGRKWVAGPHQLDGDAKELGVSLPSWVEDKVWSLFERYLQQRPSGYESDLCWDGADGSWVGEGFYHKNADHERFFTLSETLTKD